MTAPPFTILYDRSCCMFERTGTYRYIHHLQQALQQGGYPLLPFQPYPDQALAAGQPGRRPRILLSDFWHSRRLPRRLASALTGGALVHHPVLPTRGTGLCNVVTVLDLNVLHELGSFSRYNRMLAGQRLAQLRHADAVITISDFVKKELLAHQPHLEGRVTTVHLGLHLAAQRIPFAEKNRRVFLYVGGIGPNKNLLNAVRAFSLLRQGAGAQAEFRIVGPVIRPDYAAQLETLVRELQLQDHVHLLGPVSDEELVRHYREAAHFLFYSAREGFGFPVLEAQAYGCAVVCSNATSLPEIGGEGCLYADPDRPENCAEQMTLLLQRPEVAAALVERGYCNAATYSWEKCARETAAVYQSAWESRPHKQA